jgi:hypothetical protein
MYLGRLNDDIDGAVRGFTQSVLTNAASRPRPPHTY